jgi:hypothetical protein
VPDLNLLARQNQAGNIATNITIKFMPVGPVAGEHLPLGQHPDIEHWQAFH